MRSVTGPTFSMRHSNYSAVQIRNCLLLRVGFSVAQGSENPEQLVVEGAVALMDSERAAVPEAEPAALPSSRIEFRERWHFTP